MNTKIDTHSILTAILVWIDCVAYFLFWLRESLMQRLLRTAIMAAVNLSTPIIL